MMRWYFRPQNGEEDRGSLGRRHLGTIPPASLLRIGAAAVALAASTSGAHAQALQDKYWLEVAAYWPDVDSDARVQSKTRPGIATDIDFESDLDLADRDTLPSVSGGIRIGRHFVVGADYYGIDREATQSLNRQIEFDGVIYPVNASVSSGFKSDIYRLTIGYDFVRNENVEFGAALGFHVTKFDIFLSGEGNVGGETSSTQVRQQDVLAPLPTVGIFGSVKIIPRLTANARVDYLSLKVGDYKGRLLNAQASVAYRFLQNVGLGVMYRYVNYRVDVDKERWDGRLEYQFSGPAVFLQIGF